MGFEPSSSPVAYHSEPPLKLARRSDEWTKWTPVVFVSLNIGFLYFVYVFHHILPTLQLYLPAEHVDAALRQRAIVEVSIFHVFFALLLYCYVCSIVTHPGAIPDDPEWERTAEDPSLSHRDEVAKDNMQERKRSGDRRYCKWCGKYKPDRCHHCRVCKSCILKMDHHCPWIYNCVGFRNHKYFFLLLFYCVCTCQLIMWSMLGSVKRSMMVDTPFVMMFLLLFGETLAFFFGVLVTGFFCFHIWLMFNALTTIEFCEKALKKGSYKFSYASVYNSGPYSCITSILGEQPFLWLLPVSPAPGDGLHFLTDTTPLTKSMQESRVIRKRTHQRVPRNSARAPSAGGSASAAAGRSAGGYGAVDNYMVQA